MQPYRRIVAYLFPTALLLGCSNPTETTTGFATTAARIAPLVDSVIATGTIETVTSVEVSSQLSGRIDKVFVDFNETVKSGQALAELDRQQFASRVAELSAGLAAARADLAVANAALKGAEAESEEAERDLKRKQALFDKGTISSSLFDESRTKKRSTASTLLSLEAQLETKRAAISVAQAALRQGEIDLERTSIGAPIDGIVISRSIEPGQTVAASLEAPELFIIAHDLKEIEVHASIDEADIGKIRVDQPVVFQVDAHPGRKFNGRVAQIRKAPAVVQNVVTYTTVIAAQNPDELMLPGMTAVVEIISAQKPDVLQIPNAALRFAMPRQLSENVAIDHERDDSAGATVWVLGGNGVPEKRAVEIGYTDGEFTELIEGTLSAGDRVIVGYRR